MGHTRYYLDEWYVRDDSETPPVFDEWEKKRRDWTEDIMPRRIAADRLNAEVISDSSRFTISTTDGTTWTRRFKNAYQ